MVERKGKPILGFSLKLFWGKCPAKMTYHPKEAKMSWNHWVHAIGVSKRELQPLSGWECHGKDTHNRPVGSSGRTPITGQKWLRGKMVNLIMAGSIKRL